MVYDTGKRGNPFSAQRRVRNRPVSCRKLYIIPSIPDKQISTWRADGRPDWILKPGMPGSICERKIQQIIIGPTRMNHIIPLNPLNSIRSYGFVKFQASPNSKCMLLGLIISFSGFQWHSAGFLMGRFLISTVQAVH